MGQAESWGPRSSRLNRTGGFRCRFEPELKSPTNLRKRQDDTEIGLRRKACTDSGMSSPEGSVPSGSARIKIIKRSDSKFDVLRLLNAHVQGKGRSLHASENPGFLQDVSAAMDAAKSDTKLLHGLRVEGMFGYVAAAMGQCVLVKEEDAGALFYEGDELQVPDYRIVTREGWEGLIEVKNHHADIHQPFQLDLDYLRKQERYAELMNRPLFVALYWSRMAIWCLIPPSRFTIKGKKAQITFIDAFKENEMARLGDTMISTLPPLQLRLDADLSKPRKVGRNGDTPFTIGHAELLCRGQALTGKEAKIAWFLMMNGEWPEQGFTADVQDGLLNSATLTFAPEDDAPVGQPFRHIGSLSRIISRQYNRGTTKGGKVELLTPREKPDELGIIIPVDYKSQSLPLWRIVQQPASGHSA